jgi:hypothetical protein
MNVHNHLIAHNWRGNVDLQIILDQNAAIAYMVKYATKAEKAGSSLLEIYKTVILNAKDTDNPSTKLRSMVLQSVSGKRDIGQCEVCRLLSSEPLYSSTFEYINQSLDLDQSRLVKPLYRKNTDITETATIKSLLDHFMNRLNNALIPPINNLVEFIRKYKITKGQLTCRSNYEKVIVVTYPAVRYNPKVKEKYTEYCYYQLIKWSSWSIADIGVIQNKETAIERWESFFNSAPIELKNSIKYDSHKFC